MEDWAKWAPLILAVLLMVPAVICDLRQRRIPNFLCLGGFVAGLILHGWLGGWAGTGFALASGLTLLVTMFALFAVGWLGAGDVKLLAAAGAIGGNLDTALGIVLATALVGGLLGLTMLLWRLTRSGLPSNKSRSDPVKDDARRASSVPYAVAIAVGTLLAIIYQLS